MSPACVQPDVVSKEDVENEIIEGMMFGKLYTSKVSIRLQCIRCGGTGTHEEEVCDVCLGAKEIVQETPLIKVAKMLMPYIMYSLAKQAQKAQQQEIQ